MLRTIMEDVCAEIVEKKSKFIANIMYVQTVEEAEEKLKEIRKKYYDARHNCFAFSVMTEDGIINRASDDGEPSGTAGGPMLNIINKNELTNILVVVTRYFGGILLGTGGLVKAYSEATLKAIEQAEFVIEQIGMELRITISYNDIEKFNYYCNKNNIKVVKMEYDEQVKCTIEVNEEEKQDLILNIQNLNFKIHNYEVIKKKNIKKH